MSTLELKDIAGYLPYGMKIVNKKLKNSKNQNMIYDDFQTTKYVIYDAKFHTAKYIIDALEWNMPILRPVSCMYETIIHNGNPIIPIIECSKIALKDRGDLYWVIEERNKDEKMCRDTTCSYFSKWGRNGFDLLVSVRGDLIRRSWNHSDVYDFLHEIRMDYRGLIEKGLAISVYDLSENPYK